MKRVLMIDDTAGNRWELVEGERFKVLEAGEWRDEEALWEAVRCLEEDGALEFVTEFEDARERAAWEGDSETVAGVVRVYGRHVSAVYMLNP